MQISEELIKQITNAVMTEMQRRSEDPCVKRRNEKKVIMKM